MTRPDEDLVRDLIPICEVVSLRRSNDIMNSDPDQGGDSMLAKSGTMRNVQISSLLDGSTNRNYILKLQTMEDGFNSGRTYYFAPPTKAVCQAWEAALRAAVDAVIRTRTGPTLVGRLRQQLRRPDTPQPTVAVPSPSPAIAHRPLRRHTAFPL